MSEIKPDSAQKHTSTLPFHFPFFYGWFIVFIAALNQFFSGPGQTYSVSTFIDSYIIEFGWSRSLVSGMYSLGTLTAGFLMVVMGGLFDRKGIRGMTTVIILLFGIACLSMSFVSSIFMLLVGFMLIRFLGQGSMSLSSSILAPQWFVSNKGKALSLVSLGGAFSSALLPPLNTWLIQTYGWQFGWRFWAILLWVIMAPVAYFFIRDRPEDVGLWPDNKEFSPASFEENTHNLGENAWTSQEAMRTRSFWLLLFSAMVPSAVITGLIFHQISIMEQAGLSPMVAAIVLSLMALVRLPFVLVAGPIADKVPPRYLLALSEGGLALAIVILLYTTAIPLALTYAILVGVMMGFNSIAESVVWPEYFGRRYLGGIRGITMMVMVVGSAFGPLPFGIAFDLFGGYQQILLISVMFPVLGGIAALLAPPPQKN